MLLYRCDAKMCRQGIYLKFLSQNFWLQMSFVQPLLHMHSLQPHFYVFFKNISLRAFHSNTHAISNLAYTSVDAFVKEILPDTCLDAYSFRLWLHFYQTHMKMHYLQMHLQLRLYRHIILYISYRHFLHFLSCMLSTDIPSHILLQTCKRSLQNTSYV